MPGIALLVPQIVIDEFERNRPRVEAQVTSDVAQRFKLIRRDLVAWGLEDEESDNEALKLLDGLAHQLPLIGEMTTRFFEEIRGMLDRGARLTPTAADHERVVQRALSKMAPFHRDRNNVADAMLVELYSTAVASGSSPRPDSARVRRWASSGIVSTSTPGC